MKHSADLILRGLWAGVAGSLCLTFASELSLRAKRGICSCCAWNDVWSKQQVPHGLNFTPTSAKTALVGDPGSAVCDDNSEIAKPDITYTALNKAPGRYGQLGCGPEAPHLLERRFFSAASSTRSSRLRRSNLRNCTLLLAEGQQASLRNRSSRGEIFRYERSLVAHSSSASTMASCTSGRTWRIACDIRFGQVRLVSNVTESWRAGSIHREAPVNPR